MITTAPELIYMLKVNIGIALFYAFYKLFCCRDTFLPMASYRTAEFSCTLFSLSADGYASMGEKNNLPSMNWQITTH